MKPSIAMSSRFPLGIVPRSKSSDSNMSEVLTNTNPRKASPFTWNTNPMINCVTRQPIVRALVIGGSAITAAACIAQTYTSASSNPSQNASK